MDRSFYLVQKNQKRLKGEKGTFVQIGYYPETLEEVID